jgi:sugar/nucleoside kinase (ribokinase family)
VTQSAHTQTAAFGLGELLWDRLPTGDSIGGGPFNVIAHLARFGYRTAFATRVGADDLGDAAVGEMTRRAVDTAFVKRDAAPTLVGSTRSLRARLPKALAVYDVNLRDGWWSPQIVHQLLGLADVVKLGHYEAGVLVASASGSLPGWSENQLVALASTRARSDVQPA